MIGIYKITNKINNHCYIGQSRKIDQRWKNHIIASNNLNDKGYEYPLYRAFRKYGINNFSFEVIEECKIEELNDKENYWIKYYNAEYNQTLGENFQVGSSKLTSNDVKTIQKMLIEDVQGELSHKDLAKQYNVHKDTIRDINVGRSWYDPTLNYPLHYSKFDSKKPNKILYYCKDCGIQISSKAIRCSKCEAQRRSYENKLPVSRIDLKKLIRTVPFTQIGIMFNVSDNTIRKWCKKYDLPDKVKEIKTYSDNEWDLI